MKTDTPSYYNIETLAQRTGLSRRTVRYYVQRELIPKPEGGGRGHYYTDEHLRLIEKIKAWQSQGVPLEKMKLLLRQGAEPDCGIICPQAPPGPPAQITSDQWVSLHFGSSVEFSFRRGSLSDEDVKKIEACILATLQKA